MRSLTLAMLCLTACTVQRRPRVPFAEVRDPLTLARLAMQDEPMGESARRRLIRLAEARMYSDPPDLGPALPAFTAALQSPQASIRRKALDVLSQLASIWAYGFETNFNDYIRPDVYDTPFIEPLLPDIIALIEDGPAHIRYDAVHRSLTFAHLLVLMERRSPALESAMRAAQSDDDESVAAYATYTVQALDKLIQQPRCVRQ